MQYIGVLDFRNSPILQLPLPCVTLAHNKKMMRGVRNGRVDIAATFAGVVPFSRVAGRRDGVTFVLVGHRFGNTETDLR